MGEGDACEAVTIDPPRAGTAPIRRAAPTKKCRCQAEPCCKGHLFVGETTDHRESRRIASDSIPEGEGTPSFQDSIAAFARPDKPTGDGAVC